MKKERYDMNTDYLKQCKYCNRKVSEFEERKLNTFVLFVLIKSAEIRNSGLCARNPHGDLFTTKLSEDHELHWALVRKKVTRRDLSAIEPKPLPITATKVDPEEATSG